MSKVNGVSKVLLADNAVFTGFLAEALTPVVLEAHKQFNFTHIFSNATAFGKVCKSIIEYYRVNMNAVVPLTLG